MRPEVAFPVSFNAARRRDVLARQLQIGRALRRSYQAVAMQEIPAQMIELLRQADARGRSLSPRSSSLSLAMSITAAFVALFLLYDFVALSFHQPGVAAVTGVLALLALIGSGTIWLIEGA